MLFNYRIIIKILNFSPINHYFRMQFIRYPENKIDRILKKIQYVSLCVRTKSMDQYNIRMHFRMETYS